MTTLEFEQYWELKEKLDHAVEQYAKTKTDMQGLKSYNVFVKDGNFFINICYIEDYFRGEYDYFYETVPLKKLLKKIKKK
jgi:hypothetical protein